MLEPRAAVSGPAPVVATHGISGAGRLARDLVRARTSRARTSWREPYDHHVFRGVEVYARPQRLSDAASWSAVRLANEARLRAAFDSDASDWAAAQSETAFLERCLHLRAAARRGLAYPSVILASTDDEVLGEIGVDSVDARTGTGEWSTWTSARMPSGRTIRWVAAQIMLRAFTSARPLNRIVIPIATEARGMKSSLLAMGCAQELTLTRHRAFGGRLADHHLFVIHNTPASRSLLAERAILRN